MLFLMNLKNDNGKKDLCLAYSQGNITAYLPTIEAIARYLATQYPNKNSAHQREKRGIEMEKREMIRNLKTRTVIRQALKVHTLKILHHLKSLPLLAERLV